MSFKHTAPEKQRNRNRNFCVRLGSCDDRVGAAVHRNKIKCVRLPNTASIFRAELYALLLAIEVVRRSKEKNFVIFSDSMSSLQAISGFKIEIGREGLYRTILYSQKVVKQ